MFGWFKKSPAAPVKQEWVEHHGFRICATPIAEAGQYRVGGVIEKGEGEAVKQHRFVRADLIASKDEADAFSVLKAKLMIDQMGDAIFSDD